LSDVTVLDFGQIYQGPYATFLMAKAGANVIKVEPPSGEFLRDRAYVSTGSTLPFEMLNTNKRSLVIDLKSPKGCALVLKLAAKVDVVLENFAPGVMDRLGVGWEALSAVNPRLIYASGTGYGISGPDKDNLAMDITVQAASGIMSVTGFPDGPPLKAGPAVVDFLGGCHLYGAVLTALHERGRTGKGRLVEVAMQETVFPTLASSLGMMFDADDGAAIRTGNRHSGLSVSPYNVYPARDGHVAIIVLNQGHWFGLLRMIGRDDLIDDPRFDSNASRCRNMDETDALVAEWTARHDKTEIKTMAQACRVPMAPVREVSEVLVDAHMHERRALQWVDHPRLGRAVFPNSPLRIHGVDMVEFSPSADLGEHSVEILRELLGMEDAEIETLRREKVI
jgi:crotonobetainyl-CoA:carnitine CoA-transferase CaiB-like acyl-CoA transferase